MIIRYDYVIGCSLLGPNSTTYIIPDDPMVFYYESSKFVNPAIYFEVTMSSATAGSNDTYCKLTYSSTRDYAGSGDEASWSDVASTELISTSISPDVYRSSNIYSSLTNTYRYVYKCKNESSAVINSLVRDVRMVILDDVGSSPSFINNAGVYLLYCPISPYVSSSTSYVEPDQSGRFTFSSDWDGTINTYLEVFMYSTGADNIYAELYNVTDASSITNGEINTGSEASIHKRYRTSSSMTLVSGKTYTIRVKGYSTSNCSIVGARLIIEQTNPTKTIISVPFPMYQSTTTTTYSANIYSAFKYNSSDWTSTNPSIYNIVTHKTASSSYSVYSGVSELYQTSVISNSELTSTSTTKYINKGSNQLSLTDGYKYMPNQKSGNSSNTIQVCCPAIQFIMIFSSAQFRSLPGGVAGMGANGMGFY